jgi:predicted nucleic acid-binding protein
LSVDAELRFVERAKAGAFEIFSLELRHLVRVHQLMQEYRNLPMDLADASLVLLAEELGSGRILSSLEESQAVPQLARQQAIERTFA